VTTTIGFTRARATLSTSPAAETSKLDDIIRPLDALDSRLDQPTPGRPPATPTPQADAT
jgi:hypothetical protein